jgi:hypothetical protein
MKQNYPAMMETTLLRRLYLLCSEGRYLDEKHTWERLSNREEQE